MDIDHQSAGERGRSAGLRMWSKRVKAEARGGGE